PYVEGAKLQKKKDKSKDFDDKGTNSAQLFINYTKSDGLSDISIYAIIEDNEGRLYFGGNWGFNRLTPGVKGYGYSEKWGGLLETFNRNTGCPVQDVNGGHNTMLQDSKGIIWIATGDDKTALVRFDPAGVRKSNEPPVVTVQNIKVNNENICWYNLCNTIQEDETVAQDTLKKITDSLALINEEIITFGRPLLKTERDTMLYRFADIKFDGITRFYPLPENLVLPNEHNNITFEFAAVEPARPYMVKYQYILEGYDKNWSPVTNKTSASFGNIYEGTYTFKLKACNPDGVWSKPVTYTFRVLPPWWRTWWMYTAYIIAFFGFLFSIYRWRTAAMRRKQKELVREVRKATVEIREKNEELNQQNEEIIAQRDEITAQRDLVMEQKQELEKLSIVASETENGVLICGKDGTFEWVNRGFERLYGLTLEQFTEKHGKTIYETSSNPDFQQVVNEAVEHSSSITYNSQFTKETGHTVWMQTTLTPIFDDDGSLKKLVAIESDITKIKEAEEHIREQHKEITDSINYAKRIQTSALPDLAPVKKSLTDIFVLFKPKDVVSGDFYWYAEVENQIVITVADCTGHGVPGAFMSMMGMSMLKEIVVKEYVTQPDVILRKMRKEVIKALGQKGEPGDTSTSLSVRDGMDMSLCSINKETFELQWSGANNPLWIIRDRDVKTMHASSPHSNPDELILMEVKPDKMPIAIYEKMDRFTLHEINLNRGDIIYLIGDGYPDQFGGPKGKKFMSKKLKELLLEISSKPMKEQHEILENTIMDWMNNHQEKYEQTDDITIMGIKI
ncbi:MAG: SpoIIE family protein phosphatase, partial [Bacteroidetes bacterium]|nr:SpoIIE family protein phosphatase [Bacteroidota bacterium]